MEEVWVSQDSSYIWPFGGRRALVKELGWDEMGGGFQKVKRWKIDWSTVYLNFFPYILFAFVSRVGQETTMVNSSRTNRPKMLSWLKVRALTQLNAEIHWTFCHFDSLFGSFAHRMRCKALWVNMCTAHTYSHWCLCGCDYVSYVDVYTQLLVSLGIYACNFIW